MGNYAAETGGWGWGWLTTPRIVSRNLWLCAHLCDWKSSMKGPILVIKGVGTRQDWVYTEMGSICISASIRGLKHEIKHWWGVEQTQSHKTQMPTTWLISPKKTQCKQWEDIQKILPVWIALIIQQESNRGGSDDPEITSQPSSEDSLLKNGLLIF